MKVHCLFDELKKISEIKLHPKNPNRHSEDQVKRLAEILKYQGFRYPVKISKLSGFLVSGHGRIQAAIENGWDTVPVQYQVYETEDQEYADVVADNAIASWAELDFASINSQMENFDPSFDINLLGLNNFTLDVADKMPSIEDYVGEDEQNKMKFYTCPHCKKEFEEKQAKLRVEK